MHSSMAGRYAALHSHGLCIKVKGSHTGRYLTARWPHHPTDVAGGAGLPAAVDGDGGHADQSHEPVSVQGAVLRSVLVLVHNPPVLVSPLWFACAVGFGCPKSHADQNLQRQPFVLPRCRRTRRFHGPTRQPARPSPTSAPLPPSAWRGRWARPWICVAAPVVQQPSL